MIGRPRHRDAGPERESPDHDLIGHVPRGGKSVRGSRIQQQSRFARLAARTSIATIGQRDEPGAVSGDAAKAADEAGQRIAIAVKEQHDRMTWFRRDVPDDYLLAIG